jgi:hypothetical protein
MCLIAGADLAHLGPAFGTPPLHEPDCEALRRRDAQTLDLVIAGDAAGFHQDVMGDGNRRQICSHLALYTLLRVLGGTRGELLGYQQCGVPADPSGTSRVTISAVAFHD